MSGTLSFIKTRQGSQSRTDRKRPVCCPTADGVPRVRQGDHRRGGARPVVRQAWTFRCNSFSEVHTILSRLSSQGRKVRTHGPGRGRWSPFHLRRDRIQTRKSLGPHAPPVGRASEPDTVAESHAEGRGRKMDDKPDR
ncbi:uncharacterized protein LOC143516203 [Brachyhypopomus gauderio]|uniref:uncharacterized protein LOC143516203 n=1 Tax=Brachyhypopomus gauderio TaxID=698409 RepID=UPI004041B825